jgi:hypothetical protein
MSNHSPAIAGRHRRRSLPRFFYKYNPLSNVIVKNNPLQNLLPKMVWRKGEKAPRGTSANGCGGKNLPPCGLAGRTCRPCSWREIDEAKKVFMPADG